MDAYLKQWEILYEAWQMDNFFQVEGEQWVRHGQWRGTSRCGHATKGFLPRLTKRFHKWNLLLVWLGTVSRSLVHPTMDSWVASLHACHFSNTQTLLYVIRSEVDNFSIERIGEMIHTSEWWHCTFLYFEHLCWADLPCAYT